MKATRHNRWMRRVALGLAVAAIAAPSAQAITYESPCPARVQVALPVASAPTGGTDWTDAGIGAGMALGAILLGAAAALGLRRRRLAQS